MVLRLPDSWSNWNLEMLVFEERGKPEYPEKNLSEQRREPTTNLTHIWRQRRDLNPGHIGGRRVLSRLRYPSSFLWLTDCIFQMYVLFLLYARVTRVHPRDFAFWAKSLRGQLVNTFYMPRFIAFAEPSLSFSLVKEPFVRLKLSRK